MATQKLANKKTTATSGRQMKLNTPDKTTPVRQMQMNTTEKPDASERQMRMNTSNSPIVQALISYGGNNSGTGLAGTDPWKGQDLWNGKDLDPGFDKGQDLWNGKDLDPGFDKWSGSGVNDPGFTIGGSAQSAVPTSGNAVASYLRNNIQPTASSKTTYDQFIEAAQREGLLDKFGAADLQAIQNDPDLGMSLLGAKVGYRDATTQAEKNKWHETAEAQRRVQGYTTDPSGTYAIEIPGEKQNQQINRLISAMENRQFSYDPYTDPVYQAYRKQYLREGQRAMQDTLASASAMTGGRASSYAVSAAAQANNNYAAQAANMIPELYNQAYQRYMDEFTQQGQIVDMRLRQQQNQWDQAQAAYQVGDSSRLQSLGVDTSNDPAARERAWNEAVTAYQYGDDSKLKALGIDPSNDLNRQLVEQQIAMNKQSMENDTWTQKIQRAQLAASYGDYSQLAALGFDVSRAGFDNDLAIAQLIAQYTGNVGALQELLTKNSGQINWSKYFTSSSTGSSGSGGGGGRSYSGGGGGSSSASSSNTSTASQNLTARGYPSSTEGYTSGKTRTSSSSSSGTGSLASELAKLLGGK